MSKKEPKLCFTKEEIEKLIRPSLLSIDYPKLFNKLAKFLKEN